MRDTTPAQHLRWIGAGVLRVAAVAFAVAFLVFHVRRRAAEGQAMRPTLVAAAEKSPAAPKVGPVPASLAAPRAQLEAWLKTVHRGPEVKVVFGGSKSAPAFSPADAAKLTQHRDELRAEVTTILTPLFKAYCAGREVEVGRQLRELGIVVDANLRAFIAPDMDDPATINQTNVQIAVTAWNALAQPELAARGWSPQPARDPALGTQTQLQYSVYTLTNFLRAGREAPSPQALKESAARLAGYLAFPYEHGQERVTRQRLKEAGIVVGEDHRATIDPAATAINRANAEAFVDAWNHLAPRPRSLVPPSRSPAQTPNPSLAKEMSLQAIVREARAGAEPVVLGGSKSMPLSLFESRRKSLIEEYAPLVKSQDAATRRMLEGMGILFDASTNTAFIDPAKNHPGAIDVARVSAAVEAWNALNRPAR